MEAPSTILVPVDGSKRSESALEYAAMLARHTGAHVVVFTVVAGAEREALEAFAAGEGVSLEEAADAYLARAVAGCADDVEHSLRHVLADHPAEAIIDAAAVVEASMIVMASHGRTGFTRWLLGGVTDKVVQISSVPVVVVPTRD